jgi:sulfhydrogenase subunit gamma (sulfur reductase)
MSDDTRRARIARIEPTAKDQSILSLEHDAVLEAGHIRPGQYCQLGLAALVHVSAVQSYFVLIDPPGAGPLRFLLQAGGPVADALRSIAPGTEVSVRGPLGPGFPVELAEGRDVLLVSAGSGIAATRAMLVGLMPFTARRVWFYHGARTLAHVPFGPDLERAHKLGAKVVVAVSREGPFKDTAQSRVQHALERDKPDLRNAVAFVAGMPEMVDALRVILPKLGLLPERMHLNY